MTPPVAMTRAPGDVSPGADGAAARCSTLRRQGVVAAPALFLALPTLSACAGRAQPLEPMVVGWERNFRLEWEVTHRGGQPVVRGALTNDSLYTVTRVQLLVEALDATGAVIAQEVAWAGADAMPPSTRAYFELRAPAAPSGIYRVHVFWFDLAGGGD